MEWLVGEPLFSARAGAEVSLASGAINSLKLLEISGIGQPARLAELGITARHELPCVGENLQDHLQLPTVYNVQNTPTLNDMARTFVGKARIVRQCGLCRSGPMAIAPSQFGMFTRSGSDRETPDLEYHVQPLSTDRLGDPLHSFSAITDSVCNLRPSSVGIVHATTARPEVQPEIRPNYLSTTEDRSVAVAALHQARRIMSAQALRRYAPQEWLPGPDVQSDEALTQKAGDIATTIFHPVGTCRMGGGLEAVVDPALKGWGLKGLRIGDASIVPRIVSGNTASPVVMIAERAADMILRGQDG